MEEMDIDPYWHLSDPLTVTQAAALIAGYDPSYMYRTDTDFGQQYPRLEAVEAALCNAISSKKIPAIMRHDAFISKGYDTYPNIGQDEREDEEGNTIIFTRVPNWSKTTVEVEDIRAWLRGKGFTTGFFFPEADDTPDFLDKNHPNYAPKLAAAIQAWQAVNADSTLMSGTTVKQALLRWLRKNADKFGLTKEDGNPNEQGIEEIAKIANWDPKGGAPKTPE